MPEHRFAVLVDGENMSPRYLSAVMAEINRSGEIIVCRVYGDWTDPRMSGWKELLRIHPIRPIQQFRYGENASDGALIMDAIEIVSTNRNPVNAFCIVSSDSDFTRLVIRLREAGMKVFGIGEKKTPSPFIAACDKFTYLEIINANSQQTSESEGLPKTGEGRKANSSPISKVSEDVVNLISSSISDVADENGWAFLADVGNLMQKKRPDFDSRNYGFTKLTPLIKTLKCFEIDERDSGNSKIKHIYVRNLDKNTNEYLGKKRVNH